MGRKSRRGRCDLLKFVVDGNANDSMLHILPSNSVPTLKSTLSHSRSSSHTHTQPLSHPRGTGLYSPSTSSRACS